MDYPAATDDLPCEPSTLLSHHESTKRLEKASHLLQALVASRLRLTGVLWAAMSAVVGAVALFALLQPVWFTNGLDANVPTAIAANANGIVDIGILSYCYQSAARAPDHHVCLSYGDSPGITLWSLPNGTWRAVFLIFGMGSVGYCVTAVAALPACLLQSEDVVARTGYLQLICTMLMGVGLTALPFGLDAPLFNAVCGLRATRLSTGRCSIGWSYVIAILATLLSLFCPFLARHRDHALCLPPPRDDSSSAFFL